jgi:hypothetical protein
MVWHTGAMHRERSVFARPAPAGEAKQAPIKGAKPQLEIQALISKGPINRKVS